MWNWLRSRRVLHDQLEERDRQIAELRQTARRSLENPSVPLNDPDAWEEAGLLVERTNAGVRVSHKKALGHPPLWRGINLIASNVAKLRLHVYRRQADGGRERDKRHPAYRLLRRKPNPFVLAGVFKKTLTYHSIAFGNGYAAIIRQGSTPTELIILSPFHTYPIQVAGQVWYVTTIAGEQRKIQAADVLHIKSGLSFDGLQGFSLIEVMAEALGLGISARDFAARFFSQGANASGILMIPGHLKRDAQVQAIRDFEKIASGVKNQHRVGVLQDGVKWQPMTVNPEQSQMLPTQEFDVRTVANILGLPPHKLGDPTRTSFSSLEQENQSFLQESLDPHLCNWEEECEDKLLSEEEKASESHFVEFNRAQLLSTDLLTRYRAYAIGKQWGFVNTNRILAKENEEGIGEAGEQFWAPANMVPIDQLGQKQQSPSQSPAPDEDQIRTSTLEAIHDRIERLQKIEREQVLRAATRDGNFVEWVDRFYEQHRQRIAEALMPLLRMWYAAKGSLSDEAARADEVASQLTTDARKTALRIAGIAKTREQLADELQRSPLPEPDEIAQQILEDD